MIRFAIDEDLDRIKELWDESFNYDDFGKWYFENEFDIDNVLVYEMDNKIVAALQRIPYWIKGIGEATYIYGASTAKGYRNKGIMTKLLAYSEVLDIASGVEAIFLVPENEGLFEFYEKKGYKTHFYKYLVDDNNYCTKKEDDSNLDIIELTKNNMERWEQYALDMIDVYIKASENGNYIIRNKKIFIDQVSLHIETGGKVYVIYNKEEMIGYVLGYTEDQIFEASELALCDMAYYNEVISLLNRKIGALNVLNLLNGNVKVKYGCIKMLRKRLKINKIIINLVFD